MSNLQDGEDLGYDRVNKLVHLLEDLDDLIIGICREVIGRRTSNDPLPPISEADLLILEVSREAYHNTNYGLQEMVDYITALPSFKRFWLAANRSVLRYFEPSAVSRLREWKLQIAQMQAAGQRAWQEAIPASKLLSHVGSSAPINALIERFGTIDDLLDQLYGDFFEGTVRERLSDEYRDTLYAKLQPSINTESQRPLTVNSFAIINIGQMDGNNAPLTMQKIELFKSELRQRRLAEKATLNQVESTPEPPPVVSATPPPRNYNPLTTALVSILTLLAALLTVPAYKYSSHAPGTSSDADFWWLCQSSTMQLIGLLTIVLPLWSNPPAAAQPRYAMWGFAVTSLACSVVAVPLYLYSAVEYSSMVAFVGAASQGFVILQAMFVTERALQGKEKTG